MAVAHERLDGTAVNNVLAVPLSNRQLKAAKDLYERSIKLTGWRLADNALSELNDRFPDFDQTAVLLKAVAINTLYGTNVLAIQTMAEHVADIISKANLKTAGPELVEEMGKLGKRRNRSFASKFLHFFVDCERFPVMDKYAVTTVGVHLGRAQIARNSEMPYVAFVENFQKLRITGRVRF